MDREAAIETLNDLLHATVNSVVQYIEVSTPYVPPGYEEQWKQVLALRDEEAQTAHDLTEAIANLDGVPKVGVFPYWNVDLNYLDLRFLARFAVKHLDAAIADAEGMVENVLDHARISGLLKTVLDQKRRHRALLAGIGGVGESAAEPAPESPAEATPAE